MTNLKVWVASLTAVAAMCCAWASSAMATPVPASWLTTGTMTAVTDPSNPLTIKVPGTGVDPAYTLICTHIVLSGPAANSGSPLQGTFTGTYDEKKDPFVGYCGVDATLKEIPGSKVGYLKLFQLKMTPSKEGGSYSVAVQAPAVEVTYFGLNHFQYLGNWATTATWTNPSGGNPNGKLTFAPGTQLGTVCMNCLPGQSATISGSLLFPNTLQ